MADIKSEVFGELPSGRKVNIYTLSSGDIELGVIEYGAAIVSLKVPDRDGEKADIVLGYDDLDGYINDSAYFGAVAGRCANRIRKGTFQLDGERYTLSCNRGKDHLHGGFKGFNKKLWNGEPVEKDNKVSLKLSYISEDGEEGYPGKLNCEVIYSLTEDNTLEIHYTATADKPTIVNLTNHSYFNLAGAGNDDVLGHELVIDADRYTELDDDLIPTGEIKPVENTAYDFRTARKVGERIDKVGGYDINYVLNNSGALSKPAAKVFDPDSGRVIQLFCTQPGLQLYTGDYLDGSTSGKGAAFTKHSGLCLETQHFPDAVNHSNFPSIALRPNETYAHTAALKFITE
jgi:aldose 1-epimerase